MRTGETVVFKSRVGSFEEDACRSKVIALAVSPDRRKATNRSAERP